MDKKALTHLKKDPVMKSIIEQYGEIEVREVNTDIIFQDIIETILGQQLSNKAANTIINRFKALFPKAKKFPTEKQILAMPDEKIRSCGTSWSKIKYIKNVAAASLDGSLELHRIPSLSDEEVYETLVKIKGIGSWTAEMILMFTLGREDIFSVGDVGLQNAMAKHYKIKKGDVKKMLKKAETWRPFRTLAARYLWKSLDNEPIA